MNEAKSSPRVLLIGNDARTDAIADVCSLGDPRPELYAFAQLKSPGMERRCRDVVTGRLTDVEAILNAAREIRPDLVVVGPENALAAGVIDGLSALKIPAFGPSQRLARIESSKSWARELLAKHGITGNPEYRVFTSDSNLHAYMVHLGDFVIKPDGLTGGKGVRVFGEHLNTLDEAVEYAQQLIAADGKVQIEERVEGEEFSLQTITDGRSVIHCPLVQDHKRAYEGDTGPNTGGMGSYSCPDGTLPFLDDSDVKTAQEINERVIDALYAETGEHYVGVLYGGFMATKSGVRVIEYNCRFGDPEAMNVLPTLDADFVELAVAAIEGRLAEVRWQFRPRATVCKYVVPKEYPDTPPAREEIVVPEHLTTSSDVRWFWGACTREDDRVHLTSSRAGAVVGIGATLADAERIAESSAASIVGRVRHRSDIGRPEVIEKRSQHMRALRGT